MLLYAQLAVNGAVTGTLYALLALGIVLVFRTVRVLNLAHGAIATLCVYLSIQVTNTTPLGYWGGFAVAVATGAAAGAAMDRLVMARIAGRSLLAKVIATLGALIVLQTVVGLVWGYQIRTVDSHLPSGSVRFGHLFVTYEQLIIAGIVAAVAGGVWWLLRRTYAGLAMRALPQSPDVSRLLGVDVERVSTMTWAAGGALAGVAGVLLAPLVTLEPVRLTGLLPKAFAAALVGRLVSLPGTFLGGVLIGILENYVPLWVHAPGTAEAVSFFVIVLLLVARSPVLAAREQEALA